MWATEPSGCRGTTSSLAGLRRRWTSSGTNRSLTAYSLIFQMHTATVIIVAAFRGLSLFMPKGGGLVLLSRCLDYWGSLAEKWIQGCPGEKGDRAAGGTLHSRSCMQSLRAGARTARL